MSFPLELDPILPSNLQPVLFAGLSLGIVGSVQPTSNVDGFERYGFCLKELGEEVKARSKNDLLDKINDLLLERIDAGREIVVIIDEAQNLSFEVMEMLRMLSNLETYDQKLLQIILLNLMADWKGFFSQSLQTLKI